MKFNKNFYRPNYQAEIKDAEDRLIKFGYANFQFKSVSRTNGVSFYFVLEDGREARVSDHPLTGRRAFDIIQIPLYDKKTPELCPKLIAKREKENADFRKRLEEMMAKVQAKKNK